METDEKETLAQRVSNRLKSGAVVVVVAESDEQLALAELTRAAAMYSPVRVFSVTGVEYKWTKDDSEPSGQSYYWKKILDEERKDIGQVIEEHSTAQGTLIVFDIWSVHGENPIMKRIVREFGLQIHPLNEQLSRLVLVDQPFVKVPQEIVGDSEIVGSKLPSVEELCRELDFFVSGQKITLPGNGETRYSIGSAVSGLNRHEALRLYTRSWITTGRKGIDPAWLRAEKARRITQRLQGALTFEGTDGADVGGYDLLLQFLDVRMKAFNNTKARDYGLPNTKGVVLVSPPGCGKSALAKYVARRYGFPFNRFDVGKAMGSLVGQSESQTRQALDCMVACSPCVVLWDEYEKMLGQSGGLDGGTSNRVTSTILTWQQENQAPVFSMATVNSIANLRAEQVRAGRFDKIFYMGLPDVEERRAIYDIHLKRRKRVFEKLDVDTLAEASEGYSGAEIEQSVVAGLFKSFSDSERALTRDDVLTALKGMIPLSKTKAKDLKELEAWAAENAAPASSRKSYARPQVKTDSPDPGDGFTIRRSQIG